MKVTQAAEFARLLAHPIRCAVLRELGTSDRRVQELTAAVRAPQNLVSYHLGLLRREGVVAEHRSSADRRDVYYRLDLARLRGGIRSMGTGLHPALNSPPNAELARGAVLFLCRANSARSQMAEALLRDRTAGRVVSASGGTHPEAVHPLAIQALQQRGVSTDGLRSKHWAEVGDRRFDRVISLCDIAREELPPELVGSSVHWSVADPAAVDGSAARRATAFEATAQEISERIEELLASMMPVEAA